MLSARANKKYKYYCFSRDLIPQGKTPRCFLGGSNSTGGGGLKAFIFSHKRDTTHLVHSIPVRHQTLSYMTCPIPNKRIRRYWGTLQVWAKKQQARKQGWSNEMSNPTKSI